MTFKRIAVSLCTIMICMMIFISGYTATNICYAETVPSGYQQVTTQKQLTEAFLAYCKSRDSELSSSVLGASLTFAYNDIIVPATQALGLDINDIQANLYYAQQGNSGMRYFMNLAGVNAFNDIFAYFIQEKDLQVGDSADISLKTGEWFEDDKGNGCYVTIVNSTNMSVGDRNLVNLGTTFRFTGLECFNMLASNNFTSIPVVTKKNNVNYTVYIRKSSSYTDRANLSKTDSGGYIVYRENIYDGSMLITKLSNGKYYIGGYYKSVGSGTNFNCYSIVELDSENDTPAIPFNIKFISNNISNYYEGDTIINNEGDIINNNNYPEPDYDPFPEGGGTTTDPDNSGGGSGSDDTTVTFPNFDFNFPEIEWSLGDLSDKFPFSIPFDLIAFYTVLNAYPQAPRIDADIPLGTWYTWHFEADFSQFDNYAVIMRNVEFIGFCVGLIYLTIKLVKG